MPLLFVRVDIVKKPLQSPYDRPYKAIKRKLKCFILDHNDTKVSVSIDRLKPVYQKPPSTPAPAVRKRPSSSMTSFPPPPYHYNPFRKILRTL
nr:gag pol polyprotein [Hymenolepis microstoma]